MTTRTPRRTIDLSRLTPGSLSLLPDEDFRLVVDADVKAASTRTQPVPDWVAAELRSACAERWHTTLRRMQASVDGQLDAKEAEYEAEKAQLSMLGEQTKLDELSVRHFQTRARSLRFRSGLTEVVMEAEGVVKRRIDELEGAIRAHRAGIRADGDEPGDLDLTLWSVLRSD